MSKTILCYGDSNTYGYNPLNGLRYAKDTRWTGCLQEMLGSNDLKTTFAATAKEIAGGMEILVDTIKAFTKEKQGFEPVIILLSPPEIGEDICDSSFNYAFDVSSVERSKELPEEYRQVAKRKGCIFCKTSEYIKPSQADSLHLMPEEHRKLANILKEIIMKIGI